ncbi:MAG: methylmalonyl-CoA mutase family protein, partial [Actinomycetota bacterium]|nr:methylmalonyl-CoA mutase family protein [Actinomycetota bacterium]
HLVLMEEANIHRVIDPVGGSWYVESLTDQLSESAWERFQDIEKNGGILNDLREGVLQSHIHAARSETQQRISTGEQILVGVNQFTTQEEELLHRALYPEMTSGIVSREEVEPLPLFRMTEGFE